MKTNCRLFTLILSAIAMVIGCTEEVDESNRYVFKDQTIISYLEKHPDTYSEYLEVLKNTPVSEISQSSLYQLLSARGNYTVFAPTNEAMQQYLLDLVDE